MTTTAKEAIMKFEDVLKKAQAAFNVASTHHKLIAMSYMIASRIIITELKLNFTIEGARDQVKSQIMFDAKTHCIDEYINRFKGVPAFIEQVKELLSSPSCAKSKTTQEAKKMSKILRVGADIWFTTHAYFKEKGGITKIGQHKVNFLTDLALFRTPSIVGNRKLPENVDNFMSFVATENYLFALPINSLTHDVKLQKSNVLVITKPLQYSESSDSQTFSYLDLQGKQIQCITSSGDMLFCGARQENVVVVDTNTLKVTGELSCKDAASLSVSDKFVFAAADKFVHIFELDSIYDELKRDSKSSINSTMQFPFKECVVQVASAKTDYFSVLIAASLREDGSFAEDGTLELWNLSEKSSGVQLDAHARSTQPQSEILYKSISFEKVIAYDAATADIFEDKEESEEEVDQEEIKEAYCEERGSKMVSVPHKMVFDGNKLHVFGLTQQSCLIEQKSAVDTWNFKNINFINPQPYSSTVTSFKITDFCSASVAVASFPGRPFLYFIDKYMKKVKMRNPKLQNDMYEISPDDILKVAHSSDKVPITTGPDKTSKTTSQILSIWADSVSLYILCKDESGDSYLVKF